MRASLYNSAKIVNLNFSPRMMKYYYIDILNTDICSNDDAKLRRNGNNGYKQDQNKP